MQINLSELFSYEGKEKTYTQDIEMDEFQAPNGVYEIVEKKPVVLKIRHEKDRKLEMEGTIRLSLMIPCDRCLQLVKNDFSLDVKASLDMDQSDEERAEALDEQPYVSGNFCVRNPNKPKRDPAQQSGLLLWQLCSPHGCHLACDCLGISLWSRAPTPLCDQCVWQWLYRPVGVHSLQNIRSDHQYRVDGLECI